MPVLVAVEAAVEGKGGGVSTRAGALDSTPHPQHMPNTPSYRLPYCQHFLHDTVPPQTNNSYLFYLMCFRFTSALSN